MKTPNRLSKVIFDLLITRKLTSISITTARDLLLNDYLESYNSKTLYKHLYQQLHRLERYGYVVITSNGPSDTIFEVTKKFSPEKFIASNTTKIFDKLVSEPSEVQASLQNNKNLLSLAIQQKVDMLEEKIHALSYEKKEYENILSTDAISASAADQFMEQTVESVKQFLVNTMRVKK